MEDGHAALVARDGGVDDMVKALDTRPARRTPQLGQARRSVVGSWVGLVAHHFAGFAYADERASVVEHGEARLVVGNFYPPSRRAFPLPVNLVRERAIKNP